MLNPNYTRWGALAGSLHLAVSVIMAPSRFEPEQEAVNMIEPRIFCIVLILAALSACDSKPPPRAAAKQQGMAPVNSQSLQGIEQMKARLQLNPNDFETLSVLADMYFESARYVEAFETCDRAIAINPKCADCYNDRGLSLFYIGDAQSALESFDKAIAIDPNFVHAWLSKGYVLTSEGRYQEAVAPLNKVKELDTTGELAQQADKFLAIGAQNGSS
jgi:tetratricopeptide (TPR) repeat protein